MKFFAPISLAFLSLLQFAPDATAAAMNTQTNLVTNTPAPAATTATASVSFSSFKIIADRNIFNPNRSRHGPNPPSEPSRPRRVDSLTLVGILSYEKGPFAFFEGSSSEFRKVVQPGQKIGDFKIQEITNDRVLLVTGTNSTELKIGMRLRREDESDWKPAEDPEPTSDSTPTPSNIPNQTTQPTSTPPPTEQNDLLKRLMQQREKDLK